MYPWSDIEENVVVHLLKRAIREKTSGSGSSEKVRGKVAKNGCFSNSIHLDREGSGCYEMCYHR